MALGVGLTPEFLPMISSVTLTQGALRMARDAGDRQASAGHSELRQHRHSVQRQDGHADGRRDAVRSALDPPGAASPRPLTLAYVNSRFETGIRSPLDAAILQQPSVDVTGYRKIDEIPFDFERRRLSVVVEAPDGAGRRLLITKGAPEPILALSTAFEVGGQVAPLDAATTGRRARRSTSG